MGGSSSSNQPKDFNDFKKQLSRKMTIHLLSNEEEDCIKFIKIFTDQEISNSSKELSEESIKKKINLYSFMNYKIYTDTSELIKQIKIKVESIQNNPKLKSSVFSEVIIILNNKQIIKQINELKNNEHFMEQESYFIPFLLIISPNENIDLKNFLSTKTFQYKITLQNITGNIEEIKEGNNNEIKEDLAEFIRKLNVIFSYYNELGDEFSFINSEKKEVQIKIEDDIDITVFINILFLGRSGSGKSTLINLLLGEKKSIEGGTGLSTTSKDLIIYKKKSIPIRFYDVKGIENVETLNNYAKILKNYNENVKKSIDSLNAIFYCVEFKTTTIIEEMEFKIFDELINFDIPIIFIITKTPYAPFEENEANKKIIKKTKETREKEKNKIKNVIKSQIIASFKKFKKNKEEGENFIEKYVKFFFVNLVRIDSLYPPVPVFGIDKVLSFFINSVPEEDWKGLEESCFKEDEENCMKYCKKNPFLLNVDFEKINIRNREEANSFLKYLKVEAIFSGIIPGVDIGMEYLYRYLFKKKLKSLYGFDYDKAENIVANNNLINKSTETTIVENEEKEYILNELNSDTQQNLRKTLNKEGINEIKEKETFKFTSDEYNLRKFNKKEKENKIENRIENEVKNSIKNTSGIVRGVFEIAGVVVKAVPSVGRFIVSSSLKVVSWVLLPVSCIGFGTWSYFKIDKDCNKILKIFEEAFTPLKFETLYSYVKSLRLAIAYLDCIGKQLTKDDEEKII